MWPHEDWERDSLRKLLPSCLARSHLAVSPVRKLWRKQQCPSSGYSSRLQGAGPVSSRFGWPHGQHTSPRCTGAPLHPRPYNHQLLLQWLRRSPAKVNDLKLCYSIWDSWDSRGPGKARRIWSIIFTKGDFWGLWCAQSCLTLCDSMDCNPPTSSVHEIFQARIPEPIAISYSRGSSQPRDHTRVSWVSCIGWWILYRCATWEGNFLLLLLRGNFYWNKHECFMEQISGDFLTSDVRFQFEWAVLDYVPWSLESTHLFSPFLGTSFKNIFEKPFFLELDVRMIYIKSHHDHPPASRQHSQTWLHTKTISQFTKRRQIHQQKFCLICLEWDLELGLFQCQPSGSHGQ